MKVSHYVQKGHISINFHLENVLGGKYIEISQHDVPYDFLEGVAHCTLLISEHQASSVVWLKLTLSLL